MGKKVAAIPGDGVGPEIVSAAESVLDSLVSDIEVVNVDAGYNCYKRTGESLPIDSMEIMDECDAILLGAFYTPFDVWMYHDPLQEIKKRQDLYVNARFIRKMVPDVGILDINSIYIREEDRTNSISEVEELDGALLSIKTNYANTKRMVQMVRNLAEKYGSSVTCVHNVAKHPVSNGIFLRTFNEVMEGSKVEHSDESIEGAASTIVLEPSKYDFVISMNPYSDIISSEAAAFVGGAHLLPEALVGDDKALFKPMHGPTNRLEGLNEINPTAMLMGTSKMLAYLGYDRESNKLQEAIRSAYKRGFRTPDVGGETGTYDFTAQVVRICETR